MDFHKAINTFIQADTYRNECCAEVIENDKCDDCPLEAVGKCLYGETICGSCITTNEYMDFLCFCAEDDGNSEEYLAYLERKDEQYERLED